MQTRYESMFARLNTACEGAFIPFVTLGDPNLETSARIVQSLIAAGADAIELGMPFSDPLADGPIIEAANHRALQAGTTVTACIDMIRVLRANNPDTPIGLLLYANLVHVYGVAEFYRAVADAGVDSVLVADAPIEEAAPFIAAANRHQVAPVLIVPPNIDPDGLQKIAHTSEGYIYLMSRAGVTGIESEAGLPVKSLLDGLQQHHSAPPVLGFGISTPAQVSAAISAGAAGVIAGSAIVSIIEQYRNDNALLEKLGAFVRTMKHATRTTPHRRTAF